MKYAKTGTGYSHSIAFTYDTLNNLTQRKQITNGDVFTTNYTYDDDNRPATVVNGNTSKVYTYDSYGRLSQQSTSVSGSPILTESFTYYTGTGGTSGHLKKYTSAYSDGSLAYTYTYDDNGNIATVSDGTNTTRYVYDSQNQLIREYNQAAGKIWSWKYDDAGNLTYHREYEYSDTNMTTPLYTMRYTYGDEGGWGDLLTAYNGVAITYDGIGNPLNDGTWTYTWEHGRQMASMSDGAATWDMTYNADGLRTGRTNGTNTYTYWYNESGQLVRMKYNSLILRIAYGASGQPISISYNGNTYYYVLNQQGDVMALLDSSGNWVVKYTYDAWGNILTTTGSTTGMRYSLAVYNPLRYRGYVYDRETGLYYLQSRYYNPEIGRFINADAYITTGQGFVGHNMFAYCLNNPTNYSDETGKYTGDYVGWATRQSMAWIWEFCTGESHFIRQTEEYERQIIQKQTEIITGIASAGYDALAQGYDTQQQQQLQHSEALVEGTNQLLANPEEAIDVIDAEVTLSIAFYSTAALLVSSNPPAFMIAGAVLGVVWAGRGLYRSVEGLISKISPQEGN